MLRKARYYSMNQFDTYEITLYDYNDATIEVTGIYVAPSMQAAICMAKEEHGWIRWVFMYGRKITGMSVKA